MKKISFVLASMLALIVTGCSSGDKKDAAGNKSVKVKLLSVGEASADGGQNFSGTVEAESGTVLSFPVAGTVRTVNVSMGDRVNKGQLIATLDPSSLQSTYNAALSSLRQAEDAYKRMAELHAKGSLPEIKWVEVKSKLEQAKSLEEISRKNLRDCNLYAPFSGVISDKTAEAGQNVLPGTMIARLVTTAVLNVKISVPESEVAAIHRGQSAIVQIPALGDKTIVGTVNEKGIVADPLTRSYSVKLRLQHAGGEVMPGMVANVRLQGAQAANTEISIPADVVMLDENNQNFVWVASEGKAQRRNVTIGEYSANGIIISSGLKQGDQIIIEGQHKVSEGANIVTK